MTALYASIRIVLLTSLAVLLPASANAHDYSTAFEACKTAAYKQTGLEANVNQFTHQLGDYATKTVPHSNVFIAAFGFYKIAQEKRLVLKIDYSKVLTLTPNFSSITLRF